MRDKSFLSEYQARWDTTRVDVGRFVIYVFRSARLLGRIYAMDEISRRTVSDGVYADDVVVRRADDVFGKYVVGAWHNACGKRSAENRATVRA